MSRSRVFPAMLWLGTAMASAAWVFAAWNLRSPYFLLVRETVFWLWLAGGALAAAWLFCQKKTLFARLRPLHLTIFAALAGGILAGHGRWLHEQLTLQRHGVTAVLKHFPGLGRVPADTHHFAAKLDAAAADLIETDWLPFREISRRTGAGVMLGHVRVTALDAAHPASCSSAVMRDLLRRQWGLSGLLVTDDFSMTPIFHAPGGIVRAAEQSLAAGVDLILLSYDAAAVYDLLAAKM